MPLEKQCNSAWKYDVYDHNTVTIIKDVKGNPINCKGCICSDGCALTSAVMVLKYYGITTGIDGKEVNPRNLNDWLKSSAGNGYTRHGGIKWDAIRRYSGGRVRFSIVEGRNDDLLDSDLCSGRPPILNVPTRRGHFVVATATICANNEKSWTINDPDSNVTTLQGYGNKYLGLRRTYAQ